jgi:sugar porter (SP) family MFS transporter
VSTFVQDVRKEANGFVVALASIAAIGGFLFGYDTGVISGALLLIRGDLHATTLEQSAIVGSLLLGAVFGAILSGYLAGAIGRRRTKIISGCIFAIGAIWSALSPTVWVLIVARFVLGISVGTASFVSPMYIGELAPKKIRGGLVSFNQLMITTGILVAYIVDFALKDVTNNWRWMLGLGAIPGVALAVGMFFMPESPRWLVEHDREDDARDVLDRARQHEKVDEEIEEIREVSRESGTLRDLVGRNVRPMLVIGLGLAIFQQIVGINTVIYFAPTIVGYTGVDSASASIFASVAVGIVNVGMTFVAIRLLDRVGRRPLLLWGSLLMAVALSILALVFILGAGSTTGSLVAVGSLMLYVGAFAVSLGPIFWLLNSEIYPLRVRSKAAAVGTMTNWFFNFLVSLTFLLLIDGLGRSGAFFFYAAICVLTFFFCLRFVPETKGKHLEEIQEIFAERAGGRG